LCYTDFEVTGKARYHAIDQSEQDAKTQAVIENLKPACICNKIRKGTVVKGDPKRRQKLLSKSANAPASAPAPAAADAAAHWSGAY
jgi:hypothetical protein